MDAEIKHQVGNEGKDGNEAEQKLAARLTADLAEPQHRFALYDPITKTPQIFANALKATEDADRLGALQINDLSENVHTSNINRVDREWQRDDGKTIQQIQASIDRESLGAIAARASLLLAAGNQIHPDLERQAALVDTLAMRRIQDTSWQDAAAVLIAANARNFPNYNTALHTSVPNAKVIAAHVAALNAADTQKVWDKENRKAAAMIEHGEMRIAEARSWNHEQAMQQLNRDISDIRDIEAGTSNDIHHYKLADMAVRAENNMYYATNLSAAAPDIWDAIRSDVLKHQQTERETSSTSQAQLNLSSETINTIEEGRTKQIDSAKDKPDETRTDKFVADLDARLASAELEELGWRNRTDINDVMRDMEILAGQDWQRAAELWDKYRPNDIDKPVFIDGDDVEERRTKSASIPRDADSEPASTQNRDSDKENKAFVPPEALLKRYLHADNKYYYRDDENKLAFHDKGKSLATEHNDAAIVHAMVELAQAKSWNSIKVKGSEEFKREAWLQATLKGIDVEGFQAREVDIARLKDMRKEEVRTTDKRQSQNTITETPERSAVADEPQPSTSDKQQIAIDAIKTVMRARGDSEKAVAMAAEIAFERFQSNRVYVGKLIEQGAAPYEYNPKNESSYYVKFHTAAGDKTIWGVDLKYALSESNAKPGDEIAMAYQGRKPVTVAVKDRDDQGKVVGVKEITSYRNIWDVRQMESLREEAKSRLAELAQNTDRQPLVKVYDRNAPRSEPRSEIVRESARNSERARG